MDINKKYKKITKYLKKIKKIPRLKKINYSLEINKNPITLVLS